MPKRKPQAIPEPFDRQKHVYKNDAFVELVKDAIRFFNGTPVHTLPPPEKFFGTGVYALYFTGDSKLYQKYAELNRLSYDFPIYVGKAVPSGWRQSRTTHSEDKQTSELWSRIKQHGNSIDIVKNLSCSDFSCRFMIFEDSSSDMIGTIEAALIKWKTPLWNSLLDGFGNHDPGNGRYEQAKSDWDVVHPGRLWANKCKGKTPTQKEIVARIESQLMKLGEVNVSVKQIIRDEHS